ncbi:MAG: bifunctional phosphoribosylaminoimidazolecarboxamide formyltransferase/IMP cyclohydrolase [Bifidobacteriaceae bacterium]|nr:bifunctional phosphoribosylaminoimidazolecarboxamide formyltransferase/IMP cyclohydrolase [Bifidobacteriaceae bacterium]
MSMSIRRALVSVYDKTSLEILAQAFISANTKVVSTGSTAQHLRSLGVDVEEVSEVTSFPEILGGRVKTLHPNIHGGILADTSNNAHVQEIDAHHIQPFDLVVVNLYPFKQTVLNGSNEQDIIENIDIGGPTLLRAAAKNNACVTVISDINDYEKVAQHIIANTEFTREERKEFAAKAFSHTAFYDSLISQWMHEHLDDNNTPSDEYTQAWEKVSDLRYGENPHQQASLYANPLQHSSIARSKQLNGKAMSYNNYVDADAAWRAAWDFTPETCVTIMKHNNPCGIACAASVEEAYARALACDPMSAYGGVVATNAEVTLEMAQAMASIFTEVLIAPSINNEALQLLQSKKKNLRIIIVESFSTPRTSLRAIDGGVLIQDTDSVNRDADNAHTWQHVAGDKANSQTLADLEFAWKAVKSVKSNAILLAKDLATVGIGMGQVNRVDSCALAITRANTLDNNRNRTQGSVAASDAFFPFADGVEQLVEAGVKAIVQPGGSIRDSEVIEAAQKAGVSMYLTGTRHFNH